MVKAKSKDGDNDPRADWKDPKELQAFCEFCAIQVLEGKRAGGLLTKTGVDKVFEQLGDMRKVVTYLQVKNKWDHLRKLWKQYAECFDNEIGLGINAGTGMLEASDGPHCEPFVNADPMEVEATTEAKAILDMVLSLPGVQSGDRLHLFSTLFFMEQVEGRPMFAALSDDKDV
ncbi:uncharacterized protein LOC115956858 [Quercus lobata]|uniref:uncharacterized protein LOC115956858 n=1 Tax=Quercus lobata TaxID=97700 RepID=UPI001247DCE7|nr:uncharacterized protein LOC115956858 [Quercus lobata]